MKRFISHFFKQIFLLLALVGCYSGVGNQSIIKPGEKQIMAALGWEHYDRIGFDPTLGWGFGSYGPPLFQSTLLQRNNSYELVGDLAKSYTISQDRRVWKFKLREDVHFSDGHPLKASDVAYTFNTTKQNANAVDLTNLESAVATEDYEVELRLKKPEITFVNRITALGIVPKHAHNRNYARNPIGSGPYKLVQWNEGEQIVIAARPDYYGQPPSIKRLVFLLTKEDAALAAARAGQVQLAHIPASVAKAPPEGMKIHVIKNQWHTGITLPYIPNTGQRTPKGNPIGNNITADLAIRRAMNYAINRQLLIKGLLNGFGSPAMSPVPNGAPWQEPTAEIADADLKTARKILAAGGWHDSDGTGILKKQGMKAEFSLIYPAQDRLRQGFVLAVAKMLKPVGIKVNVEGKSWDYIERHMHSNPVIYVIRPSDPKTLQNIYYSPLAQQAWSNPSYYSNPLVDKAIEGAMTSTSEAQANVFWRKLQWDGQTGVTPKGDAAFMSLVNIDSTYVVSNCLNFGKQKNQNYRYNGTILDNITTWKWVCK